MKNLQLERIRSLIAENKIKEAFKRMLAISSEINNELYKDIIGLSAQYRNWDSQETIGVGVKPEERNRIVNGLLKTIENSEIEINKLIKEAEEAEQKGDYHVAVANVEKVLIIVEDENLREYKASLTENILAKSPPVAPKVEKFSFFWAFVTTALLTCILPLFIYNRNPDKLDIPYIINLVFQISLLACMVLYTIKPRINVNKFIQDADDFIREKFNNRIDYLKWFSERANESIKQFGVWWRLLGFSFLALYVLYYFQACVEGFGGAFLPENFEEYVDVFINGSEAFFLFVLYRIITDDTIKPSPEKEKIFDQDLNFQAELGVLVFALVLFIFGNLIYSDTDNYGVFSLISRTISGAVVAVGLCLVIGRLDSKFIEPERWELWLLYLYAAIQLLFTLFDPSLFKAALSKSGIIFSETANKAIVEYFQVVKMWVLYFILVLKGFFIYFVINIHRRNELFYYLLLGSKLNDEIKEGKKVNKSVLTKE